MSITIRKNNIIVTFSIFKQCPELFLKCMGMSVEKSEQESTRQRVEKAILAVSCNNRGVEGMSRNGMTFLANVLGMVVYILIVGGLDIRILGLLNDRQSDQNDHSLTDALSSAYRAAECIYCISKRQIIVNLRHKGR